MNEKTVFEYITSEENAWKTTRIPLTGSKDWNMSEHIERCTNVANAWFHSGKNDGTRPYDDIVTPIINVAFRTEGFDVKDIVPYVDDVNESYKSFIIKKLHPQWARRMELDTLIDDVVETSVIYDLVLMKDVNSVRPEVVDLKTIAFCDQTDVLAGPICLKHQYTIAEMVSFKGKWDDDKINQAILQSSEEKTVSIAGDQKAKTPSKYITVYELRGMMPEYWLKEDGEMHDYVNQMHLVCYYHDKEGNKQGITLYKGEDKPLTDTFKALKIDRIRSKGRACGRSIVESLFEPQVWNNYAGIKLKKMLDSAVNLVITDSEELANQKLTELKDNTILKQNKGDTTMRLDGQLQNLPAFQNYQTKQENSARIIGSASDAQLGSNPTAGTPFALQALVVQEGQGIHEYRQGKIATFFADVLYRDWILGYLVKEINTGVKFSEELSLDEMQEVASAIGRNVVEDKIKRVILETGKIPTEQDREMMTQVFTDEFMKGGNRKFFETIKGELKDIPVSVMINIKGKQRRMAQNADKITNIIREVVRNPQMTQVPGIGKALNELLEESGMSPIDWGQITKVQPAQPVQGGTFNPKPQAELQEQPA